MPVGRAIAVSILLSPLGGYLALARWGRALAFAGLEGVLGVLALGAILDARPVAVLTIAAAGVAIFTGGVADVARLARIERRPRLFLRGAIIGALGGITLLVGALQPVRAHAVGSFRAPAATMLPTLMEGDRFFVDKRARPPRRGEVVVFRVPPTLTSRHLLRVKRAVALGGDTVEMRGGTLLVNGATVPARRVGTVMRKDGAYEEWEESAETRTHGVLRAKSGPRSTFGPVTVPEGHFFMLGDNRDRNNDSRLYDAIPVEMIVGRPVFIWWSREPGGRVRWERIGRRL